MREHLQRLKRWILTQCGRSAGAAPMRRLGDVGEGQLAWTRLVICLLLLFPATISFIGSPGWDPHIIGFWLTLLATLGAVGFVLLQRRRVGCQWLGFLSSGWDVTIISLALLLFIVADGPLAGLNSKTTFEIYFLTLAASALRYDVRVCLFTAFLAMLQYALILAFGTVGRDLTSEMLRRPELGRFSLFDQYLRLAYLGIGGALSTLLVRRSHRLFVQSISDPVTGLGNRHYFESAAATELAAAIRAGLPCTVAVIDVDHFKVFNDVHGHSCGDEVLRRLGTTLTAHTRSTDVVARWGGEEFVVVMPGADRETARWRLELLRREISTTDLGIPEGNSPRTITISAGIATCPGDGIDVASLFRHADMRMLIAKQRGRDRIVAELSSDEFEREMARRRRVTPKGGWPYSTAIELLARRD
jgi:diguanylate cyclase (GGDEF)-like protein